VGHVHGVAGAAGGGLGAPVTPASIRNNEALILDSKVAASP
jgi:hypothetical protein